MSLGGAITLARRQHNHLTLDQIKRYGKYFSELKLQDKIREVASIAGEQILLPVLRLWYVFRADTTPAVKKAYILGALGYFILPLDVIPDALGLLGFSDDLAVVMMITKWTDELLTPRLELMARETYHKLVPCLRQPSERQTPAETADI